MRVFIAINISSQAKKEIKKLHKILARKHWSVKWEKLDKLHLTLAFLGWRKPEKIPLITKICRESAGNIEPFRLSFKGLGCFPDYDRPRVIWLGLKGNLRALAKLQKQLNQQLKENGFKINQRPFSPHITLGRIKRAREKEKREIGRQLKRLRILDLGVKIKVDKIIIYQSQLSRLGAEYKEIKQIALKES